ncbi:heptaprenyl diphosphate synthase [Clostridium novyi A str. 4552]|uniref:Heptaprenyl diphosphate synthase n=1 Tax=Clostridium novyi A str. 4552 TaxID=1444289 RepID=A0A0A0I795_CLONO|nr:Gx transporter family protein [Clostridium novyi]KGM96473.1 heptaprenyl diphosphate synthase [Clostridium novyi A str. 4552]
MKTRRMTLIALLVAQGLVLHVIEGMLPIPFIAPGARLGLTNIVTLMALYILDFNEVLLVVVLRVLLSTLIAGNMSSFMYSIAGGIFSFLSMYTLKRIGKENVSIIGVSIIGAVFHNIGQVIVAGIIINNAMIVSYLPILLVAAIGTGIFVGVTGKFLLPFLERLNLKR